MADGEPDPLITLFRQCVVRVDGPAGAFLGTGFFVAPGVVLTCAHVVHGADGLRVTWQGRDAVATVTGAEPPLESVADPGRYPLPDLAVLEVDGAGGWGHPCAALDFATPALGPSADCLYLAGYTVEHGPDPSLTGVGTEFESLVAEDGHEFYKLKHGQVLGGFSGSPLLNMRTLRVAAIAESTRDKLSDVGGFAVPVAEAATAFSAVCEANGRHQADDPRWERKFQAQRTLAATRDGRRNWLPLKHPFVPVKLSPGVPASELLRPRRRVVRYTGRHHLLADLADWCEATRDGAGPAVWFVTGAGGFGKTRLALEVCADAEARGWTAGLLRQDTEREVNSSEIRELAKWPGRLLIAVDYAETRPAIIRSLIEEFTAHEPRQAARIILLVRRQATRRDLNNMFNPGQDEELTDVLRGAGVSRLEDASAEVDRLGLFDRAVQDFTVDAEPAAVSRRPGLKAMHFARPLYVLAAALLTRRSPETDVDALTEHDLLREVLGKHEAHYWERWDQRLGLGLDTEDRKAAVAIANLITAANDAEALTIARLIPGYAEAPEPRLMEIARWLAQLYPAGAGDELAGIGPLERGRETQSGSEA